MTSTMVSDDLRTKGYSLVAGIDLPIDPALREHEKALAAEWEKLETDKYLKEGARFRERRYSRFLYSPAENSVVLLPHRPYFQSTEINDYAGGVAREVAPLAGTTLVNPLFNSLIAMNYAAFPLAESDAHIHWEIQCHQFRIIARPGEIGEPTPEGVHRDEIDYGAIHLMSRSNVAGGASQVYSNDDELIEEFCLLERMDTMYWADQQVQHAVTPVTMVDTSMPAVRDILIFGFERARP